MFVSLHLNNRDFRVLIWDVPHLCVVWKRRKDLLYLGSFHGGGLSEFYGFTGDHVGTDALSMSIFLPSPSPAPVTDEDYTSQFHQPSKPQPSEGFQCHQPVVRYHLAEIHPREQGDVIVQR